MREDNEWDEKKNTHTHTHTQTHTVPKCKGHFDLLVVYNRLLYCGTEWYLVVYTMVYI